MGVVGGTTRESWGTLSRASPIHACAKTPRCVHSKIATLQHTKTIVWKSG